MSKLTLASKIKNKVDSLFKRLFSQQDALLENSTILEEKRSLRLMLLAVFTTCLIVGLLILWAALVEIKETTVAPGEIVPKNKIQIAQHLEGGIINAIYVENGDFVRKGDLLLALNSTANFAELEQLRAREFLLTFESARLRAYTKGETDLSKSHQKLLKTLSEKGSVQQETIKLMLEDEERLLKKQISAREEKKLMISSQIAKHNESIDTLRKQQPSYKNQLDILEREKEMKGALLKEQLVSEGEYLKVLRDINKAKSVFQQALGNEKRAQKEILEANFTLQEALSTMDKKAFEELVKVTGELLEVQGAIQKQEDKIKRLEIRAPEDGVVKGLEVMVGSVIAPGGGLLEIVPQASQLIAETEISPRDIGYMSLGIPVRVKVTAYDYSRYGFIKGKLTSISASTFKNEEGESYYKGLITLEQQYVGKDSSRHSLISGMSVQADLITGEKTLLQYLLKPIYFSINSSFRER